LGFAFEDFADALHLVVELAALGGGEGVEGFYRDIDPSAGAALVPDAGDGAVDEKHGKVAGLAAGQGAFSGAAGEEQLAGMAADDVGVEVG
jgi:hypothetical protein